MQDMDGYELSKEMMKIDNKVKVCFMTVNYTFLFQPLEVFDLSCNSLSIHLIILAFVLAILSVA